MRARAGLVAVLLLVVATRASAIEPADLRGLAVVMEEIPEAVHIDGVASHLTHARGGDVLRVVERIERRWRAQGHPLQRLQVSGWTLLTRLLDGHNEVLQWRGEGADAQLLFSRIDVKARPRPDSAAPFLLPSLCRWGRVITGAAAGGRFEQRSARCRAPTGHAAGVLRTALSSQGWQVSGPDAALLASRDRHRASLVLLPGVTKGESWLVWIDAAHPEGGLR